MIKLMVMGKGKTTRLSLTQRTNKQLEREEKKCQSLS